MEQVIYGITLIVYGIFIIRFILSWVCGDFDADFDGDLDISDVVSFKGLTHLLMGSFSWLSARCYISHSIAWYDYIIAIILGIFFVVILFYIYKLTLKLECKPTIYSGKDLIGKSAKIYATKGKERDFYRSIITVNNGIGTIEYDAMSESYHSVGDMVVISGYDGAYYIIN